MRQLSLVLLGACGVGLTYGQVQNNSIKDRIRLELNAAPIHSSTAKSTVEWDCVNRALTNKCLVYHNDQWYYFSVDTPRKYYLNISAQDCRDKRGVQVIVIEGNPCETNTYRILQCIPKITHEEAFIPLGELKSQTTYLIEIDGFLGDYCAFDIQISTKPLGIPLESTGLDTLGVRVIQRGKVVDFRWTVLADSITRVATFKVYKSLSPHLRSELERIVPVERNAYGAPQLQYSIQDTVDRTGVYRYLVFGLETGSGVPLLVGSMQASYKEKRIAEKSTISQTVSISLNFDTNTEYEVRVYEQEQHVLLGRSKNKFDVRIPHSHEIDFGEYIKKGLKSFLVLVVSTDLKEAREYYFTVGKDGRLVKN